MKLNTQELIDKIIETFNDYDNESKHIGILDFMTLLIQATKRLNEQDEEIYDLHNEISGLNANLMDM
jgi:hypothetical protein